MSSESFNKAISCPFCGSGLSWDDSGWKRGSICNFTFLLFLSVELSVLLMLRTPSTMSRSSLVCFTSLFSSMLYLHIQCAAVTTQLEAIRVPPQAFHLGFEESDESNRAAIHGYFPLCDSTPPTILWCGFSIPHLQAGLTALQLSLKPDLVTLLSVLKITSTLLLLLVKVSVKITELLL